MDFTDSSNNSNGSLQSSLRGERDRLRREIEQLREEIAEKERLSRAKVERLGHVQALLPCDLSNDSKPAPKRMEPSAASTPTPQLLVMVERVLRERNGEPMHYRDLADEILRRGAVIRGQDPAAALVSRMTQDDSRRAEADKRFIRPTSKGFYALREDYPDARNVGARRRRRRAEIS